MLFHYRMAADILSTELLASLQRQEQQEQQAQRVVSDSDEFTSRDKVQDWLSLVEDIDTNSQSVVVVLSDILNYDKLESATLTMEVQSVGIWDLVSAGTTEFSVAAVKRELNLQFTCQPHDPQCPQNTKQQLLGLHVLGDSVRLTQVVRNLVSNSLKFGRCKCYWTA